MYVILSNITDHRATQVVPPTILCTIPPIPDAEMPANDVSVCAVQNVRVRRDIANRIGCRIIPD